MIWKIEGFNYEKIGTKGVPFGYLEFLRAFMEKICPHAHTPPPPPAPSRPARRQCRSRNGAVGMGCFGSVLFGPSDRVRVSQIQTREVRIWMRARNLTIPDVRLPVSRSGRLTPTFRIVQTRTVLNGSQLLPSMVIQERYK